jgi:hypothetical protein
MNLAADMLYCKGIKSSRLKSRMVSVQESRASLATGVFCSQKSWAGMIDPRVKYGSCKATAIVSISLKV